MLRFMRSRRVGHDWATELNWTFLMWLCPSCLFKSTFRRTLLWRANSHSKELKSPENRCCNGQSRRIYFDESGRAGSRLGAKGSLPSSLWDETRLCPPRWLWFSLSFVPICSPTHVTLVGLSWCFWLAARLTQFLDPLTSILGRIILPCFPTRALLGNILLVEPGTDIHFFHLRSDINFLLIDMC